MPNRIVRDGILTSDAVSSLSWAEEVFYRRLMSVADDHGRFHAAPKLIRAACYPLLIDKVSDADIGKWLTSCVTAALVSVYPAADGKRYLTIIKFGQQVRSASKFPEPCADGLLATASKCDPLAASAHLGVFVSVGVVGADSGSNARASRLANNWEIPSEWAEWAKDARPDLDPTSTAEQFRDYWCAKPGKDGLKLDWLATWRNWVKNQRSPGPGRGKPANSDAGYV